MEIDWSYIAPDTIVPKLELRRFTKSISDTEIRLAVMKFLHSYARYYFFDSACGLVSDSFLQREWHASQNDIEMRADEYINSFQSELATQISQIENTGEFSGNRFSKLQKRNDELEKQVEKLTNKQKELLNEIDFLKNPYKYGKHIPNELKDYTFYYIMEYLVSKNVARISYVQTEIGPKPCCYYWDKSKALFGYFVVQMNKELDLCASPNQYNWKVFEPAIQNYEELIDEARKAVSKERKNPKKLKPEGAGWIMEAISYANKKNEDKPKAKIKRI